MEQILNKYPEIIGPLLSVKYSIMRYGEGYLLGFDGPKEEIIKCHNQVINFTDHDPKLNWIGERLGYIYLNSYSYIEEVFRKYFYVSLLRLSDWKESEKNGEIDLTSPLESDQLAHNEQADSLLLEFMESFVKTKSFITLENFDKYKEVFYETRISENRSTQNTEE